MRKISAAVIVIAVFVSACADSYYPAPTYQPVYGWINAPYPCTIWQQGWRGWWYPVSATCYRWVWARIA